MCEILSIKRYKVLYPLNLGLLYIINYHQEVYYPINLLLCSKVYVYESAYNLYDVPTLSSNFGPEPTWPAGGSDQKHATRKEGPGADEGPGLILWGIYREFMWFICDYGTFSDVYVILWEFRTDVWRRPRIHGIGMMAATYMIDISTKWKRTKNIGWYCLFRPSAIDDAKTWYPSTIIFFNFN